MQNFAVFIESLFGEVAASENTENIISIILQNPIFALAAMVGGPIMEEFVFRRALVGIIAKYSNIWVGVIVSAVAFAFAHSDNHLLVYILLGLFFLWTLCVDRAYLDIHDYPRGNEYTSYYHSTIGSCRLYQCALSTKNKKTMLKNFNIVFFIR